MILKWFRGLLRGCCAVPAGFGCGCSAGAGLEPPWQGWHREKALAPEGICSTYTLTAQEQSPCPDGSASPAWQSPQTQSIPWKTMDNRSPAVPNTAIRSSRMMFITIISVTIIPIPGMSIFFVILLQFKAAERCFPFLQSFQFQVCRCFF